MSLRKEHSLSRTRRKGETRVKPKIALHNHILHIPVRERRRKKKGAAPKSFSRNTQLQAEGYAPEAKEITN